jgi:hypothetical protein
MMNAIADSLGVRCDHCHVRVSPDPTKTWSLAGGWVWDRDDKQPKRVAREMMRMVMDVNSRQFGGRTVVTCYTCHRGTVAPDRFPPLPPRRLCPRAPSNRADAARRGAIRLGANNGIRGGRGFDVRDAGHPLLAAGQRLNQQSPRAVGQRLTAREDMNASICWTTSRGLRATKSCPPDSSETRPRSANAANHLAWRAMFSRSNG